MTNGGNPRGRTNWKAMEQAILRSAYVRYFVPIDPRTTSWSPALLNQHAALYLRRSALAEFLVLVTSLWIWPGMPLALQIPLGLIGGVWTWVACWAIVALRTQGKSVWRALLGDNR